MDPSPSRHIVVVAHGSRADAANQAHRVVVTELEALLGVPVHAAFLELAEPTIPDAIVAAAAAGATRVEVLPHFLYPGRHLREDIPALVAQGADQLDEVEVVVVPASGDDPAMVALLAAQLDAGRHRQTMF